MVALRALAETEVYINFFFRVKHLAVWNNDRSCPLHFISLYSMLNHLVQHVRFYCLPFLTQSAPLVARFVLLGRRGQVIIPCFFLGAYISCIETVFQPCYFPQLRGHHTALDFYVRRHLDLGVRGENVVVVYPTTPLDEVRHYSNVLFILSNKKRALYYRFSACFVYTIGEPYPWLTQRLTHSLGLYLNHIFLHLLENFSAIR